MPPLCKELYARLTQKFGRVNISNEGHSLQVRTRKIGYEMRTEILNPGEYYCISCPFCDDKRQRLWVNHRFAEYKWLAVCYNETRCMDGPFGKTNRGVLYDVIFDGIDRIVLPVTQGVETTPGKPLDSVALPGEILFINELPEGHRARDYLETRGYDISELSRSYGVGVCTSVFNRAHYPLTNRIFIPVIMNGNIVGWQGRYAGDTDWKACNVQKYFNLRGMSKKDMLYNFDSAKTQDMVVIVEGAADVWRVGSRAVGIMGSDLSEHQAGMLRQIWAGKPVAVMLDKDAYSKSVAIVNKLSSYFGNLVFAVNPDQRDPGSMTTQEVWQSINAELHNRGLEERQE